MSHPFYLAYGVLLLGLVGVAEYRGWSPTRINEVKNVPRTVRDNPGAYRSHYAFLPRYIGGK
ncbi:MAG: hypothetical protein Q8N47_02480 [Bryobacterales bacterium]|jgi:hypothetical protein|nr:hypothetical protein [Bryobacterales bacterium]